MQYMNTNPYTESSKSKKKPRKIYLYVKQLLKVNNKNTRACQHSFPTIRYTVICIFIRAVNMQCDSKTYIYRIYMYIF